MRNAIVTGGAGFIGSHLVETLLEDNYAVTVIDNLSVGRIENLHSAFNRYGDMVQFIEADVSVEHKCWTEAFAGASIVFHLAARADIVPSIDNPKLYFDSNVGGTVNVLQAMRDANVNDIVYAASSSCYGIPNAYPTPESTPVDLRYPYAASKYFGEQTVAHFSEVYGLRATSLRLFNVYGPRARTSGTYGAVFGVFMAQKFHGHPLTVVGDGTQTRDFTYVSDVVRAFVAASKRHASKDRLEYSCYNVGSGATVSINRLTELLGGDSLHIPKRPGEPDCTFACIAKITATLDWEPEVSIEEGIGVMLQHIDQWSDAPVWNLESIKDATTTWFKHLK